MTITEATNSYFSDKDTEQRALIIRKALDTNPGLSAKEIEVHDLYTILSVSAHPSYLGLQRYAEALYCAMNNDLKKMNNHLSIIFRGIVILGSCFLDEYKNFLDNFENQ